MSNTIAGVALTAVAEETLAHLTSVFAPLRGIVTDFSSDVAPAGASVVSRIPTKPSAADLSGGYTAVDTTLTAVTINLTTMYGFVWGFTDYERTRSAVALNDLFITPSTEALGNKVFGDIWNLVTNANFSSKTTITAANYDRSDLADLGATLTDTLTAPKSGRTVWSSATYHAGLVKSLNGAEFPGQSSDKAEATVPRTAGFDIYESNQCDGNSENLGSFAFHRSALCCASRRIDATGAQAAGVEVVDMEIPGLGFPFQLRRWYDPTLGSLIYSCAALYGVSKGTSMGTRVLSA